jgi:hypothetical protein
MKTEIKTVELKAVTADEGMVATNGEIYSEVGGTIYVPSSVDEGEFHEITEEECNKILAEEKAKAEATIIET